MRVLIAIPLAAALLAGCGPSTPPPPPPPTVAPIPSAVSGNVNLRDAKELGATAKLDIKVIDVAQPEIVLAQVTIPNVTKAPIPFNLPIDPGKVDPKRTYAIDAVLTDDDRRYLPVLQAPVLTNKPKPTSQVDVVLAPEPTPSEKMFEEYHKAMGQIGNMKSIRGSALNDKSTTAWDAFISNGKVKVVREITDLDDDKGRITMKMAYQGDDPWVVVKEESAAGSTKSNGMTKIGWDDKGKIVLNEKPDGSELSDAEAKAIYTHAQAAFKVAQAQAPAVKK